MTDRKIEKIDESIQFEIMRLLQTIGHLRNNMKELHSIESKSTGTMLVGYRPKYYEELCEKYKVDEVRISWSYYKPIMVVEAWQCEEDGNLKKVDINFTESECKLLIEALKKEVEYWTRRNVEIRDQLTKTFEGIRSGDNHKRNAPK